MSLTLPTEYGNLVKLGNINENWIVQLGYDNFPTTSTDFLPISLHPATIGGVYYRGIIKENPSIRTSFDLAASISKSGNVTLTLNNINYKGNNLSEELFNGTRNYINRVVKIYSCFPSASALADCLQIAQLRLVDIQHDTSTITLNLVEARPWDFLSIPSNILRKSIYEPISYGNFTKNTSTEGTPTYCANYTLRPCPIIEYTNDKLFGVIGSESVASNADGHFYDKNIDKFVPVKSTATASTSSYDTENITIPKEVRYSVKWKPNSFDASNTHADWVTEEAAYDTPLANDTSTAATVTQSGLSDGDNFRLIYYQIPNLTNEVDTTGSYDLKYDIAWEITATSLIGVNSAIIFQHEISGGSFTTFAERTQAEGAGTESGTFTVDSTAYGAEIDPNSPLILRVNFFRQSGGTTTGNAKIFDLRIEASADIDHTDVAEGKKAVEGIEKIYTSADGLTNSFTGGSGNVTTGLEAHRDILARFVGVDDSDANIYNYNANLDIEANRITSPWNIRWWALEPVDVKKVLEQLQYEFGFIFKWRADGTMSYWYIKDSYSSGDEEATLTELDVKDLKVSNSPFSELLTKMNINYEKHPSKSGYISSVVSSNSTSRTDYNIQSLENIAEVNLDMNVDTPATDQSDNPNDDFYSYYDNIFGSIKTIIDCEVLNPKYYGLETGDIIKFDYPVLPFGGAWTKYFMITSMTRSIGSMKIKCREVG